MSSSRRSDKVVYFAKEDKLEFLNIIGKYKDQFEKNDFTGLNVKTKKGFWKLIEKEYNEISPKTGPRTGEQLQCLYKNLKRKARNDAIREIGSMKTPMKVEESRLDDDQIDDETQYIFLKPSVRSSDCVSEVAESSTTLSITETNDEFVVEPLITLETIQNSLSTNYRPNEFKIRNEPVSSTKRSDEQSEKMKLLKFELETKKKEANINHEIALLRKEIEWKNKETAVLEKKAKLEEIQNQRALMKLQIENEVLRNEILKIELTKAQQTFNAQNNNEIV